MINEQLFCKWWDIFHADDPLVEIRAKGESGGMFSGLFSSCHDALEACRNLPEGMQIYSPFNLIQDAVKNKVGYPHDAIVSTKKTIEDGDIENRRWIMVDIDPVRMSGVSASDKEKAAAYDLMKNVGSFLRGQGFASPVVVDSGNGYHLYYRVAMPNNEECKTLVEQFLKALDYNFSNSKCDVDTSVFNAGRITKVVGSMACKGIPTADRPWRIARFMKIPKVIEVTDADYIRKVADLIPEEQERPTRYNGYHSENKFDIDSFIREHGIQVAYEKTWKDGMRKIVLRECPFNSSHKAPDSAIFISKDGAIGFKCLHNSCSSYTWRDVRLLYEPDAYSRLDRDELDRRREYYSPKEKPKPVILKETEGRGKKWLPMSEVAWVDPDSIPHIRSGFTEIDRKIKGFALGEITILTGTAGSGKSTLLDTFILSAVQQGYKVGAWSGELTAARFQQWLDQTAAGRNCVETSDNEHWYCPKSTAKKINAWLDGKFWLRNNEYGSNTSQLLADIKECVEVNGTQLIVLDNLMCLALDAYTGEKTEKQIAFINELNRFAQLAQVSVILVCHPRKENLSTLLRMESISGASELFNMACNVILAHRVNRDFEKRASEFFGKKEAEDLMQYDEVLEVAKNRMFLGLSGLRVGLYYEYKSRRYLNDPMEYVAYGWQDESDAPREPDTGGWSDSDYFNAIGNAASTEEDMPDF